MTQLDRTVVAITNTDKKRLLLVPLRNGDYSVIQTLFPVGDSPDGEITHTNGVYLSRTEMRRLCELVHEQNYKESV